MMAKKEEKPLVTIPGMDFEPDLSETPEELVATLRELEIIAPHQKADALVGQTFVIRRAKAVPSELEGPGYYYFCECADFETGEKFTTSLGGEIIVSYIEAYVATGRNKPLKVTLRFAAGKGQFDGYYYAE